MVRLLRDRGCQAIGCSSGSVFLDHKLLQYRHCVQLAEAEFRPGVQSSSNSPAHLAAIRHLSLARAVQALRSPVQTCPIAWTSCSCRVGDKCASKKLHSKSMFVAERSLDCCATEGFSVMWG